MNSTTSTAIQLLLVLTLAQFDVIRALIRFATDGTVVEGRAWRSSTLAVLLRLGLIERDEFPAEDGSIFSSGSRVFYKLTTLGYEVAAEAGYHGWAIRRAVDEERVAWFSTSAPAAFELEFMAHLYADTGHRDALTGLALVELALQTSSNLPCGGGYEYETDYVPCGYTVFYTYPNSTYPKVALNNVSFDEAYARGTEFSDGYHWWIVDDANEEVMRDGVPNESSWVSIDPNSVYFNGGWDVTEAAR